MIESITQPQPNHSFRLKLHLKHEIFCILHIKEHFIVKQINSKKKYIIEKKWQLNAK